jgi:hypothetical protein
MLIENKFKISQLKSYPHIHKERKKVAKKERNHYCYYYFYLFIKHLRKENDNVVGDIKFFDLSVTSSF